MRGGALMVMAAAAGLLSCETSTEVAIEHEATLRGTSEVPPVTTQATGSWSATIDANNVMTYTLQFSGLGSNITMAHIHGPAAVGVNAGILVDFAAGGRILPLNVTSGTATGTVNLAAAITAAVSGDSLRKLLDNGNAYVNVHTVSNPGGEIRGQIVRQ